MQLMDCLLEAEKSPRDNHQRKKLGNTQIFEEPELSHSDLHVDASTNVCVTPPKSEKVQKKKHIEKRAYDSEELVRHMSNLPSYLERGKLLQEKKAFNVGVLDWKHLERWQKKYKHSQIGLAGKIDEKGINPSFKPSQPSISLGKSSSSPPICTNLETGVPKNTTTLASSDGPIPIKENAEATKVRNPSPTRRLIIAISGKNWSSNAKDTSNVPPTVKQLNAQSGQERAKSSPLRRLLDPLMKPRRSTSDHFTNPSEVDSTSRNRRSKSAPKQVESSTSRSMKVKLDLKGCRTIEIGDACRIAKHKPSRTQALFQVSVKNGVPLFKFAVENEGDILAATMKQVNSPASLKKNWVYSFCTIREMKKKCRNWENQGGKDKSRGYVSSIIAQMKVSDVPLSDRNSQKFGCQSSIMEFVLFDTEIKESGQQISDLQPTHELAAIAVNNSAQQDLNMTVILPGGNHGLPGKGEPSPLIERWKSGGSCDCGGWDLGCKLRVLANHNDAVMGSTAGRFELFYQGEDQENKPVFSLCTFKDGIFSVEYSSSLTLLQAFSICIATLNVRKQDGIHESTIPDKIQAEFPGKYISIPPISPVGRV